MTSVNTFLVLAALLHCGRSLRPLVAQGSGCGIVTPFTVLKTEAISDATDIKDCNVLEDREIFTEIYLKPKLQGEASKATFCQFSKYYLP